jgi:DNA-binding CsgD family transcriptional regulator
VTTTAYGLARDEGEALWFFGMLNLVKTSAATTSGTPCIVEQIAPRGTVTPLHRHADDPETFELVECYLRLGRHEAARSAASDYAAQAAAKGQPWACARAARCRGLLAAVGDIDEHFDEALQLHAQTPDVFEIGRTRLAYGRRLRRARRRVHARAELRQARHLFDQLGAVPWAQFATDELAATGETARPRHPSALDRLTAQERQVALLLARGGTTREAASSLFLSPKTIEYHLRNVYRKLDIRSRQELAQSLPSSAGA